MKKFMFAIVAVIGVAGASAFASAEERVVTGNSTVTGAAIGAGTGAVIAGPPGVVGGVIGAVVGGPKIVYYQHHRSYTDEHQRHYYWDNHHRHYY